MKKKYDRNFWPMVMEGSLSIGGFAFFGMDTVSPMFVMAMGGNEAILGVILTLVSLVPAVANLIVGPYASYIKNQARYCTILMAVCRPLALFIMPVVLLLELNPTIVLIAFAISFISMYFGNGLVITAWEDLFARVMKERDRDRVYNYQLFIGGAFGVFCGFLVSYLLDMDGVSQAVMYSILFALGGFFNGISAVSMGLVRDTSERQCKQMPEHRLLVLKEYYSGILTYWKKNREFRKLYGSEILRNLSNWICPFVILMGGSVLGLSESQLAVLVIANIIGGILSGVTWHLVSSKWGPKGVIVGSFLMLGSIPVFLFISMLHSTVAFVLVFVIQIFMGHIANDWVGFSNYTLLLIDEEERPEYLVFHALLKLPFSFISMLAGVVSAAFGYWPLAVVTFMTAAAGLVAVRFFKK